MKRPSEYLLASAALLCLCLFAPPAVAQQSDVDAGITAFREQRYEDAARLFERAVDNDPQNSEAHFLLARVYYETPLKDRRRAQRSLDRAIEIEPDNVQYLVARLIHLREESWNFVVDKIRESKRRALAREILEIDSTNAFAHEEMGVSNIRDFWRYRNAVMMPDFNLARRWEIPSGSIVDEDFTIPADISEGDIAGNPTPTDIFDPEDPLFMNALLTLDQATIPEFGTPGEVFLADEFHLDRLRDHGVPIRDLSARASRVYNRAVYHLTTALNSNPRQRSVYDELMKVFALRGDYQAALQVLQQMFVYFPDDAATWMYLGFANYRGGNPEAAAKSFDRALEKASPDVRRAFEDIRFIVPDDEHGAFDADPVGYASKFWTSKDPRYLTPYNERKIEHFARLVYADLLYGVPAVDRRGWDTERGQILVRYGPPPVDVVIIPDQRIDDTGPNRQPDATDPLAQREESVNELRGFEVLNTYNIWDYGDFRFVFEDPFRTGEYRLYSPSAEAISQRALPWRNDYVIEAKETIREHPETYEYRAPGRQIELPLLVSAFKGDGAKSTVFLSYGVPVNEYDRTEDFIQITANEGTFVVGSDREILVEQRRTIYGLGTNQILDFDDQSLWMNTRSVSADPGRKEFSVELEMNEANAVAVQRRAVDVPDFSGTELQMSDVMLAYNVEETLDGRPLATGEVVRHGYSIRAAPWSVFSVEQPIFMYFEFYSLSVENGSTSYEIEGRLERKDTSTGVRRIVRGIFGRGDAGVSVRQPGSGSSPDESQYLIMDVTGEEPGLYTLVVAVTDATSGRTVEREVDLFLE